MPAVQTPKRKKRFTTTGSASPSPLRRRIACQYCSDSKHAHAKKIPRASNQTRLDRLVGVRICEE
jgi:hypothetical protein